MEAWFDDPETVRYMGGRGWVRRAIDLVRDAPGCEFRGRTVLARHVWVVYENGRAAGLIDVEPYDDGTAGFAFVVAPEARRRGLGRRILAALDSRSELREVRAFIGGVEPENLAARRCLTQAGFHVAAVVDEEEMLRIKRRRAPTV